MDKSNSVNNGGFQLPIGFRFHPTDEELLVHYLKRKVYSFPLPASVIPELNVFQSNPSDLPGDVKEKRYFFCKRKWNVKKCSRIISTCDGSGYWKAIGKDKAINNVVAPAGTAVGTKKSFVFYQGKKRPHGLKTRWVMHEYRLVDSLPTPNSTQKLEDWIVCCIYQRKRKSKNHGMNNKGTRNMEVITAASDNSVMDFMIVEESSDFGPPQPSPSCSSVGTSDLCFNELLDQEEEACSSAYNISFTPYFSCLRDN